MITSNIQIMSFKPEKLILHKINYYYGGLLLELLAYLLDFLTYYL